MNVELENLNDELHENVTGVSTAELTDKAAGAWATRTIETMMIWDVWCLGRTRVAPVCPA